MALKIKQNKQERKDNCFMVNLLTTKIGSKDITKTQYLHKENPSLKSLEKSSPIMRATETGHGASLLGFSTPNPQTA